MEAQEFPDILLIKLVKVRIATSLCKARSPPWPPTFVLFTSHGLVKTMGGGLCVVKKMRQ